MAFYAGKKDSRASEMASISGEGEKDLAKFRIPKYILVVFKLFYLVPSPRRDVGALQRQRDDQSP
jgi:hypothetical protein